MLHIGVIGLGRCWRKFYKPALRRLRDRVQVRAVCDQVQALAEHEAERLGCQAVLGPTALLQNQDIHALLLLDPQWFGLWPVEVACRFAKPVYCCAYQIEHGHGAESVLQQVRDSGLWVMVDMLPRVAPAAAKLQELLDAQLGSPRMLLAEAINGDGVLSLADWCAGLFRQEPQEVRTWSSADGQFTAWFCDFGDGRAAQITRRQEFGRKTQLRLRIIAEHGTALVTLPGRLRWHTPDERHALRLPAPPVGQVLLERFCDVAAGSPTSYPSLEDACRAAGWLRSA